VIEGVGGTMVPIGGAKTVRDLIEALHLPAVVVSGSYLGAISHLLTAVESLQVRGINVAGIVVSESAQSPVPLAETTEAIARLAPQIPLMTVPRLSGTRPWVRVPDLGQLMK
jgi:dethiobiotin synthetase